MAIVRHASSKAPHIPFIWTHVGDGPDFDRLAAGREAGKPANLEIRLVGRLPHGEVSKLVMSGRFDVLINASTSEGAPVSIMEAMSFGIPAFAPDVGGIAEVVGETGVVYRPDTSVEELADLLIGYAGGTAKTRAERAHARKRISDLYNSETNFPEFVRGARDLLSCSSGDGEGRH
jgi:glycosyltransferase involved in cell wall biosynthesis